MVWALVIIAVIIFDIWMGSKVGKFCSHNDRALSHSPQGGRSVVIPLRRAANIKQLHHDSGVK